MPGDRCGSRRTRPGQTHSRSRPRTATYRRGNFCRTCRAWNVAVGIRILSPRQDFFGAPSVYTYGVSGSRYVPACCKSPDRRAAGCQAVRPLGRHCGDRRCWRKDRTGRACPPPMQQPRSGGCGPVYHGPAGAMTVRRVLCAASRRRSRRSRGSRLKSSWRGVNPRTAENRVLPARRLFRRPASSAVRREQQPAAAWQRACSAGSSSPDWRGRAATARYGASSTGHRPAV